MNRSISLTLIILTFVSITAAQKAAVSYPGVSAEQAKQLQTAKKSLAFPLPAWVPSGFKIEKIDMKLGARVPLEERSFVVIYSRPSGKKTQRFSIEAGLDGIGDLPYETTHTVRSSVGRIDIAYEPTDIEDDGKKTKNFVMTQWFEIGRTAYHYDGMYGADESGSS